MTVSNVLGSQNAGDTLQSLTEVRFGDSSPSLQSCMVY